MRNRIVFGCIALGAVAAVTWYLLRPEPLPGEPSSAVTGGERPAAEAAPLRHNALLTAALPAAKGALSIAGKVMGPAGPVAGAVVVASQDGGDEDLAVLEVRCDSRCESKLLDASCPQSAAQLLELVLQRRGEAPPLARATTGADGTFSLEGLEEGSYALWAEKSGELIGLRRAVKPGGASVDVAVDAGMVIRGRAVTDKDQPVAGAAVTAIFAASTRFFDSVSGADGSFAIGPLPRGRFTVVASAPGLLPEAAVASGTSSDLRKLHLWAPRRLGGTVTRDEQPAVGVTVTLEGPHQRTKVVTGEGGAFAFPGLRPGRYSLVANEGTSQARAYLSVESGKDVLDVALRLGPGGEIAGTVRSASGQPVADARVYAGGGRLRAEQRTGPDGAYRLSAMSPGKYTVRVKAEKFLEADGHPVEVTEGGTATADFTLEGASPLSGLVLDEAGKPVEDAMIQARSPRSAEDDLSGQPRGSAGSAHSDRDGTFSVDGLAPGTFEVWVLHSKYQDKKLELVAPTTDARIVLPRGIELTGSVLDEEDRPVPGALVVADSHVELVDGTMAHRPGDTKSGETDARGEFTLTGLQEGPCEVTATLGSGRYGARQATETVSVHAPKTGPVQLKFPKGLTLSGKVVDKDGKPVAEARVVARAKLEAGAAPSTDLDGRMASAESGDDGTFVVRNLKAGTFEVTAVRYEGRFPARAETVVAKAGDTDVKLVLATSAKIRGRVVQESGAPITHFKISRGEYRDPQGLFEIPRHLGRVGTLLFEAEGFAATELTVSSSDEKQDVDLGDVVLGKGRSVSGKVLDARTNAPIAGALVDVGTADLLEEGNVRLSTAHGAAVTRADGSFTLPHVEPVALGIFATFEGYRYSAQPLGAAETSVTIRLVPGAVLKGSVTDAAGKPVPNGVVMAFGPKGASFDADLEAGAYRMVGLPGGRYVVRVRTFSSSEPPFLPQLVDVPESGEAQLDFKEATGSVKLIVSLPEGLQPALVPGEVALPASSRTEDLQQVFGIAVGPEREGTDAVFARLAPGPYTLVLIKDLGRGDSVQMARQSVQVSAEPEQRIAVGMPSSFQTYTQPKRTGRR